jgi:hypothetical protein
VAIGISAARGDDHKNPQDELSGNKTYHRLRCLPTPPYEQSYLAGASAGNTIFGK